MLVFRGVTIGDHIPTPAVMVVKMYSNNDSSVAPFRLLSGQKVHPVTMTWLVGMKSTIWKLLLLPDLSPSTSTWRKLRADGLFAAGANYSKKSETHILPWEFCNLLTFLLVLSKVFPLYFRGSFCTKLIIVTFRCVTLINLLLLVGYLSKTSPFFLRNGSSQRGHENTWKHWCTGGSQASQIPPIYP